MANGHLAPRPKEEVIRNLEEAKLDKDLIRIIENSDVAYQFVAGFISQNGVKIENLIIRLNGLCEVIRKIR